MKATPWGEAKFSPLDAIPKRDSEDLRIIMNLSYPHDQSSVNSAMDKNVYLGKLISLRYPTIEDLVRLIYRKGRGCLLFKRDLWKCYRQIYMDPGFIHLLGFVVQGKFYFDVVLTMGLRIACYICQRITNALMFLYKRLSYEGINYLDDLGGAEVRRRAWEAYCTLGRLLQQLGIWEAVGKATPPTEIMTFLGIRCNSMEFTLEITEDRLLEIMQLVEVWLKKQSATLKEVQSLAGKLNFVCTTVRSGRVFLTRILNFLRLFHGKSGRRLLDADIKMDLRWWHLFLKDFNGVSMFPELRWSRPDSVISTDSCLSGCGGWAQGDYFHCKFPSFICSQGLAINELECLAVVVAVRIWLPKLENRNVLMYCDNETTVQVINRGVARNKFSQACLQELVWLTARNNTWVKMCYLAGSLNRISDNLSRFHLDYKYQLGFKRETEGWRKQQMVVRPQDFQFGHDW